MQPADTSHVLPLIGTVAAIAAIIPERWFKLFFFMSVVGVPLAFLSAVTIYELARIGVVQSVLVFLFSSMMAVALWSFPALFGLAVGMVLRLGVVTAKDRWRS